MRIEGLYTRLPEPARKRALYQSGGYESAVTKGSGRQEQAAAESGRAVSMEKVTSSAVLEEDSLLGAKLRAQEYERQLEDARINDPEKYDRMIRQRRQDAAKSFKQLEELAGKSAGADSGMAFYNGVPINFDFKNNSISVGNVQSGDVIHVGELSNGYSFSFNMDNVDAVIGMLDLFSPEDVNKIMAAITEHNMAERAEEEIEEDKSKTPENAREAEETEEARQTAAKETAGSFGKITDADAGETGSRAARAGELTEKPEGLEALGGGSEDQEDEEKQVESTVVTNPDGSRQLVIRVKIGDSEVMTKVELTPKRGMREYNKSFAQAAYEQQFVYGHVQQTMEQIEDDLKGAVS